MTDSQPQLSASLSEWTLAALLVANVGWTTLCLGGYRPETMVVSSLLTGFSVAVLLVAVGFSSDRVHPATWGMLPFLFYAALNAGLLSPVPWIGWRDWLTWVQMAAVFALLLNGVRHPLPRKCVLVSLVILAVVAVLLACYQRFLWPDWLAMGRKQASQFIGRASGPFGIPNSLASFLLLIIRVLLALTTQRGATLVQRILCGYVCAVLLVGLGLTISRGAWLSLLGAILVWPLCLRERSWEWRVSASVAATMLALLAGVVTYTTVPRVKVRFDQLVSEAGERSRPILWRAAWSLFEDSPVVGTGAGSYNVLFERHRPLGFRDEPQWAHNDYLNTLSDYGLVGFALCFGGMGWIGFNSYRNSRKQPERSPFVTRALDSPEVTRGLAIGLLAFAVSLLVDFHLKIPALGMLVALVAADCVLRCWPAPAPEAGSSLHQVIAISGILVLAVLVLGLALPTFRSEALRYPARQEIDRLALVEQPSLTHQKDVFSAASSSMTEASLIQSSNGQAWSDRAYVTELWARIAPARARELGKDAEEFARMALSQSQVVPEFWIRLGVALDLQGRWADGGAAFVEAIRLAPSNAIAWYYYAYHLYLTPATRPLAESALNRSLALDPSFQPAIRLHQGLSLPH